MEPVRKRLGIIRYTDIPHDIAIIRLDNDMFGFYNLYDRHTTNIIKMISFFRYLLDFRNKIKKRLLRQPMITKEEITVIIKDYFRFINLIDSIPPIGIDFEQSINSPEYFLYPYTIIANEINTTLRKENPFKLKIINIGTKSRSTETSNTCFIQALFVCMFSFGHFDYIFEYGNNESPLVKSILDQYPGDKEIFSGYIIETLEGFVDKREYIWLNHYNDPINKKNIDAVWIAERLKAFADGIRKGTNIGNVCPIVNLSSFLRTKHGINNIPYVADPDPNPLGQKDPLGLLTYILSVYKTPLHNDSSLQISLSMGIPVENRKDDDKNIPDIIGKLSKSRGEDQIIVFDIGTFNTLNGYDKEETKVIESKSKIYDIQKRYNPTGTIGQGYITEDEFTKYLIKKYKKISLFNEKGDIYSLLSKSSSYSSSRLEFKDTNSKADVELESASINTKSTTLPVNINIKRDNVFNSIICNTHTPNHFILETRRLTSNIYTNFNPRYLDVAIEYPVTITEEITKKIFPYNKINNDNDNDDIKFVIYAIQVWLSSSKSGGGGHFISFIRIDDEKWILFDNLQTDNAIIGPFQMTKRDKNTKNIEWLLTAPTTREYIGQILKFSKFVFYHRDK